MSTANMLGQLPPQEETKGAFGSDTRPAGTKIAKACKKHRADHSNPGGVVSMFFWEKRTKL